MTNIQASYLYELIKILCYIFIAIFFIALVKNSPKSNISDEQREKDKKLLEDMFKANAAM